MKLHRDLGISQPTAWFMLHRIREGWKRSDTDNPFTGPVEVDETYMGGKRRNMAGSARALLDCLASLSQPRCVSWAATGSSTSMRYLVAAPSAFHLLA